MSKKKEEMKQKIKLIIIALMVVGMALSAIAPAFAEEKERVGDISEMDMEERIRIKDRETEEKEIRVEAKEIREELKDILETVTKVSHEEKRVYAERVPRGFSFGYQLREGARGEVIRYLQMVLNLDPNTVVSQSGGGSPGNETEYFGPATRNALMRFQGEHGISRTGILGPQTRQKMNEILNDGLVIKEEVVSEIREDTRERVRDLVKEVSALRERVENLGNFEDIDSNVVQECREDIKEAHEYALGKMCTDQFKQMTCENVVVYGAPNGCVISFLEERGWE